MRRVTQQEIANANFSKHLRWLYWAFSSGQRCRIGTFPIRPLPLLPTPEQVGKMGQAIHHHLCAIQMPQAKDSALRVITLLARNHIPELVAAFLDFSTPLDRYLALPSSLSPLPLPSQGHSFCTPVCPSQPTGTPSAWCKEGGSASLFI